MSDDLCFTPAAELAARIRRRDISPVEVVEAVLDRIERLNGRTNSYVTLIPDEARRRAQEAERAVGTGEVIGPLHGVPVAIKDLFDYKAGVRNTYGSKPLKDTVSDRTTVYVERLENSGAIILGKTNTPEFGHKGATDNFVFGPTSTPFAPGKNAGGSSGGSAAAVSDGLCALAQGTDAGGSIRIPASCCGVYGFKASYGRVATTPRPDGFNSHTPFTHSGPLSRTVEDSALMLNVMAGEHPRDPFSLPGTEDYVAATRRPIEGFRIAYNPNFDVIPVEDEVGEIVRAAVGAFESAEASVEETGIGIEHSQRELSEIWEREQAVKYAVSLEGMKRNGIDLLGDHRNELTPEYAEVAEMGTRMSALEYKLDDVIRTSVFDTIQDVFDNYDLLVTPTLSVPTFDNADNGNTVGPSEVKGEKVDPLIGWCLTHPINFTGHPAASIPAGFTSDGLPVGLQIIGRRFADGDVLAASAAFERIKPWHDSYDKLKG